MGGFEVWVCRRGERVRRQKLKKNRRESPKLDISKAFFEGVEGCREGGRACGEGLLSENMKVKW